MKTKNIGLSALALMAICVYSLQAITHEAVERMLSEVNDPTTSSERLQTIRETLQGETQSRQVKAALKKVNDEINARMAATVTRAPAAPPAPPVAPAKPPRRQKSETEIEKERIEGWVAKAKVLQAKLTPAALTTKENIQGFINDFAAINTEFNIIDPYQDLYSSASIINLSSTPTMRESQGIYLDIYKKLYQAARALGENATALGLREIGEAGEAQRAAEQEAARIEAEKQAVKKEQERVENWVAKAKVLQAKLTPAALTTKENIQGFINDFAAINNEFKIIDPFQNLYSSASIINLSSTSTMRESQGIYLDIYKKLYRAAKALSLNATTLGLREIGDAGETQRAEEDAAARAQAEKTAFEQEQSKIEAWVDAATAFKAKLTAITNDNLPALIEEFNLINSDNGITAPYNQLYSTYSPNFSISRKMRGSMQLYKEIFYQLWEARKQYKRDKGTDAPTIIPDI
jgi:hypothetical protein